MNAIDWSQVYVATMTHSIARTPDPPCYAVIFTSLGTEENRLVANR